MRKCNVKIGNDGTATVIQVNEYIGEHSATSLVITLNDELASESINYYTLSFKPGAALKNPPQSVLTSDMITSQSTHASVADGVITYPLPAALTCFGSLDVQVNAHTLDEDGNLLSITKSPVFRILFDSSVTGDDELLIEDANGFTALIHTALAQLNLTIDEADDLCDKINEAYEAGELNGPVVMPHIDENGTLTWSNEAGLENPEPVNLMGPRGEKGEKGDKGDKGDPGEDSTINGYNRITLTGGENVKILQENENITISADCVPVYHTLPESAKDGDLCLYSPANTLTAEHSKTKISFDWEKFNSAIDENSMFEITLYNGTRECGGIYANVSFTSDYTEYIRSLVLIKENEEWSIDFVNGVFNKEVSYHLIDGEHQELSEPIDYFDLPEFTSVSITAENINGNIFYTRLMPMIYHGEWIEAVNVPTKTSQLENDSKFITLEDLPESGNNGEDIYTKSIEIVEQLSDLETYNVGDVNTANANSVQNAEFWITNISPMIEMRGKVLHSITFNAVNTGQLIFYGSTVIIDKSADKDTIYAAAKSAKTFSFPIAEITTTAGINTYKFDGTDTRVNIVHNSLICPNTLGFGGSALYKYNTNYNTGNVIAFASSTESIGTSGIATTVSLAFNFECCEQSKKVIKLTLNNGDELTADLPTTDTADTTLPLDGKKLSILGDSTSTYSGYNPSGYAIFYPQGDITSVEQTWWKSLANETGLTILKNCAWSGSTVTGDSTSTTNAIAGCSTKRIADLANGTETPDIIICYIGINDFGLANSRELGDFKGITAIPTEGTISTFSEAYGLMLKKIMETYPNAFVYCCTLIETKHENYDLQDNTAFPVLNSKGIALEQYNEVIRKLCGAMGARLIELHESGINYWNVDNFTTDGIHPNVAGSKLVKEKIKSKLLSDYQ